MLGFIIFGWPKKLKDYGRVLPAFCDYCQNQSVFHLVKTRRWITIFFIPILPLERANFYTSCEICESSYSLPKEEVKTLKRIKEEYEKWEQGRLSDSEFLDELNQMGSGLSGWEFDHQPQLEEIEEGNDPTSDRGFQ